MKLLDLHNHFRLEENLPILEFSSILNEFAQKDAKWLARRKWLNYWNWYKREKEIIEKGFIEIDFNIAAGNDEDIVLKHLLNDREKRDKMYNINWKYFGCGKYYSNYCYWCILYGR